MAARSHRLLLFLTLFSLLPAPALAAYLPSWTQQSYTLLRSLSSANTPGQDTWVYGDGTTFPLDIPADQTPFSTLSQAGGAARLNLWGSGVFEATLSAYATSNGASGMQSGYALSEVDIQNEFTATTTSLQVNYEIGGWLNAALSGTSSLYYTSFFAELVVEDVALGYSSDQIFTWADHYYDNDIPGGDYLIPLTGSGASMISLTPGRTYAFNLTLIADGLASGFAKVDTPVTVSFSFSDPNVIHHVSEPQGLALFALGLFGLAGVRLLHRRKTDRGG